MSVSLILWTQELNGPIDFYIQVNYLLKILKKSVELLTLYTTQNKIQRQEKIQNVF